jgi:hypothetical protein
MKSLFSLYGLSGVKKLLLYTEGTENVSWVKGIDARTGSGFGGSSKTYTEGGSYITLQIDNTPTGFMTANIAGVTNSTVDITGYKRAVVDWEVISSGTFGLIVSDQKNDDINEFDAKVTYGAGTGRKTSYLAINALTGSYYIRVNAIAVTAGPDEELIEIRIHKVWLEK